MKNFSNVWALTHTNNLKTWQVAAMNISNDEARPLETDDDLNGDVIGLKKKKLHYLHFPELYTRCRRSVSSSSSGKKNRSLHNQIFLISADSE